MKIFLDDFTMYSDMESHLQKCKKYGISLNPNKCAFIVVLGMILGFIVSKEGKILDPKQIQKIVNMPIYESPKNSSIQWDGTILQMFYKKLCCNYGNYH
jgi:hypothetical protein